MAPWTPAIFVAEGALEPWPRELFARRLRERYDAPAIRYDAPDGIFVGGRHLAVVSAHGGLVADSVHMTSRFRWPSVFDDVTRIEKITGPALITVNGGARNYYHWTVQSLASILLLRAYAEAETAVLVPELNGWRRDGLVLFGVSNPMIELPPDCGMVVERAILTNVTGGDFAFAPHPAVLRLFQAPFAPSRPARRRRLYLTRRDVAERRTMINEDALCRLLEAHGFEIVAAGSLPVAEQATPIRDAEIIVAPHGGALTNLVFAHDGKDGPHVIELLQADYLNRCFAKIAQAKRLRYTAIVNACATAGATPHLSSWTADLGLVEAALKQA